MTTLLCPCTFAQPSDPMPHHPEIPCSAPVSKPRRSHTLNSTAASRPRQRSPSCRLHLAHRPRTQTPEEREPDRRVSPLHPSNQRRPPARRLFSVGQVKVRPKADYDYSPVESCLAGRFSALAWVESRLLQSRGGQAALPLSKKGSCVASSATFLEMCGVAREGSACFQKAWGLLDL
ncbi:hypothetical protein BDZ85DRAFT_128344 [Elsinoe ampelina]|uniref:Uncharacterized protein n=1 Tax=Elsinoe ampelina TaxID=302913 RepID=A0A6A6G9T2_9PEZI|nr:hypothetical protein BDZ85DRAFT_128344 [Elsinoe ampelina]